jgi:sulfoxide reductase heme-binding subunit YedZ
MTRWNLFAGLSAAVVIITAVAYAMAPDPVLSLQYAVRMTARLSFILFLAAFTASSLATLAPSAFSKALIRERRYLGLSFAFSHLVHAVALIVYINAAPEAFWIGRTAATNVPGSIGYVMVLLLTITSFKAPARLIGPHNWKRLHRTGVWIIAVVFAASFVARISHNVAYAIPAAIMIAAMLLRAASRQASARVTR